jgi:hypothetical protein
MQFSWFMFIIITILANLGSQFWESCIYTSDGSVLSFKDVDSSYFRSLLIFIPLTVFNLKGRPLREQQEVAAAVIQRCYRKYKQVSFISVSQKENVSGPKAPSGLRALVYSLAKEHYIQFLTTKTWFE